jgi:hypothetical protein
LEGLAIEEDCIFYGHFVQFRVFCYILWTFGEVRGNLVDFYPFWYFVPRKIWQPCTKLCLHSLISLKWDWYVGGTSQLLSAIDTWTTLHSRWQQERLGRVARWYIFIPKIPICIFWRALKSTCWSMLWQFGNFVIWYTFPRFG